MDKGHLSGLGQLNTTGGIQHPLDVAVDGELTSGDGTDEEETGTETAEAALQAELLGNLDQTSGVALTRSTLGLVDLGKHGVGRLRDNSSSETSNETRRKVDTSLLTVAETRADLVVDGLRDLLENDELGHGVGNPARCQPIGSKLSVDMILTA